MDCHVYASIATPTLLQAAAPGGLRKVTKAGADGQPAICGGLFLHLPVRDEEIGAGRQRTSSGDGSDERRTMDFTGGAALDGFKASTKRAESRLEP